MTYPFTDSYACYPAALNRQENDVGSEESPLSSWYGPATPASGTAESVSGKQTLHV